MIARVKFESEIGGKDTPFFMPVHYCIDRAKSTGVCLRAFYEVEIAAALSWVDSSVGGALFERRRYCNRNILPKCFHLVGQIVWFHRQAQRVNPFFDG